MDGPRIAFDTETTGQDPTQAHLVTAFLSMIAPDGTRTDHEWLADPGIEIPDGAAEVHGVTTEKARADGRPEADVIAEINGVLDAHWGPETPLIIFNAPYDLTLMDHRGRALGQGERKIRGPVLDALALDRTVNRYRKGKRKLGVLCPRYGVELSEDDAHAADADALAAAALTWAMAASHRQIADLSLRELYVVQKRGHRLWAHGFQDWLRGAPRKPEETDEEQAARRVAVINDEWPMQTWTEPDTTESE